MSLLLCTSHWTAIEGTISRNDSFNCLPLRTLHEIAWILKVLGVYWDCLSSLSSGTNPQTIFNPLSLLSGGFYGILFQQKFRLQNK